MGMKSVEKLEQQLIRLRSQRREIRRKEQELERSVTERMARLIGKVVLARVGVGALAWPEVRGWLDEGLNAAGDRMVFELPRERRIDGRKGCSSCQPQADGKRQGLSEGRLRLVLEERVLRGEPSALTRTDPPGSGAAVPSLARRARAVVQAALANRWVRFLSRTWVNFRERRRGEPVNETARSSASSTGQSVERTPGPAGIPEVAAGELAGQPERSHVHSRARARLRASLAAQGVEG